MNFPSKKYVILSATNDKYRAQLFPMLKIYNFIGYCPLKYTV